MCTRTPGLQPGQAFLVQPPPAPAATVFAYAEPAYAPPAPPPIAVPTAYLAGMSLAPPCRFDPTAQYIIQSVNAPGLFLNVSGGSTHNGANIHLWNDPDSLNTQWRLVAVAGGAFNIVSVRSGKVSDSRVCLCMCVCTCACVCVCNRQQNVRMYMSACVHRACMYVCMCVFVIGIGNSTCVSVCLSVCVYHA